MRVSTDGFIDIRDQRRVRTPGSPGDSVEPMAEADALSFLLSHSFPGHRAIVRPMTEAERRLMRMAGWADSVQERMALVDRVWRAITAPVLPPASPREPHLVQVVEFGHWAYPIYLDGSATRVMPPGGLPVGELGPQGEVLDLGRRTA